MKIHNRKHWLLLAAICAAGSAYAKVPPRSGQSVRPSKTLSQADAVLSLRFSPDARSLAIGTDDGRISILSIPEFRTRSVVMQGGHVHSLAFSPDSQTLYSASGDLYVREARTGALRKSRHFAFPVKSISLSPDGGTLAIGFEVDHLADASESGAGGFADIALLNTRTQHIDRALPLFGSGSVAAVAFSPGGRTLAAGLESLGDIHGGFEVWKVATWRRIHSSGDEEIWDSVAFSGKGRVMASGSRVFEGGGRLVLRNPQTGSILRALDESGDWTYALAFSPDGRILASGHMDIRSGATVLKVWDVHRRRLLWSDATPGEPYVWANAVAISPDGKWLAFGGEDKRVRIWSLSTITKARVFSRWARVPGAEWERYSQ